MMKTECICLLGIMSGIFAITVFADAPSAIVADFSEGGVPDGWTVGNGEYRSPEYSNAVDRIELRYAGSGAASTAAVFATSNLVEEQVATFTASSAAAAFDFPETTDFRSFRVATANGLALSSFAVYVSSSGLAVPAGVAISNNTTGTSFDACWDSVAGATGYRVYVWTNAVVDASAGTVVWRETFANSPAKPSSTPFDVAYTDSGESAWTFDKVYAHSEPRMVRIGNTSAKGVLVSPALGEAAEAGEPLVLCVNAWKQEAKDGDFMPIGIVSGDVTNVVEVLEITTTPTEYHITLPALSATDRLVFHSPTNKSSARAILDDVAVVSGYSAGREVPSYIVDGQDVGAATTCTFADLPPVPVYFAVEAYGKRGVTSTRSEPLAVDLSNPDKVAALNACPVSSLTGNAYTQDFDSLAEATATTGDKEWLNGTTLQYWQAYKDDAAVTSFKHNGGAANTGGLYALATSPSQSVRALGAYSTRNDEFSLGIAFTNDTDVMITLSSVAYSAQQWGFNNNTNQTLSVSAQVSDGLGWISSYADGWTELASTQSVVYGEGDAHDTPVSSAVNVSLDPAISVAPGQVLMLKWTVHSLKSGTPGVLAVDDVVVTFASLRGFAIRIADGSGRRAASLTP